MNNKAIIDVRSSKDPVYQLWINEFESETKEIINNGVKISVIVPVYNVEEELLTSCIESVLQQTYSNKELILVDDFSSDENVRTVLHQYDNTPYVKTIYRKANGGISQATNDGVSAASGDYIAFLDCDDVLSTNALNEIASLLYKHPEYDFIYTDEDKLSEDGKWRSQPFFKPDWSPDTFLSMNYTNHLSIFRTRLIQQCGGLRTEYNGAQDYDLTFRILNCTSADRIGHIAKVLYHWRQSEGSTAEDIKSKPYALEANKAAKEDALKQRGIMAHTEYCTRSGQFNVVYDLPSEPLVSIIIPSKDNAACLFQCLDSIHNITEYKNYEIILVDNGSSEDTQDKIRHKIQHRNIQYIYEKKEFNFSHMCNLGAEHANGELLLFLNDDIEIIDPQWLTRMAAQALQPHTGAVGAKLLYPGGHLIQHCGVINLHAGPSHAFVQMEDSANHYFSRNIANYNYIAVTGACLMLTAEKFNEVKGFDEDLTVSYNDVDLCFKLYEHGYYNVVRNDVTLIHKESVSRGNDTINTKRMFRMDQELRKLADVHPSLIKKDPFLNPNLNQNDTELVIRVDDAENGTDYGKARLIKGPAGEMMPHMAIRTYGIVPGKTTAVYGRVTTGNYEMDHHGTIHVILDAGKGRILEVEPVIFPADHSDEGPLDASGEKGMWYIARIDDRLLWRNRHRIGISINYNNKTFYCWTDIYIQMPGYICHHCWSVPAGTIAAYQKKRLRSHIDALQMEKGAFQISGWAFFPHEWYNFRYAFHIYLKTKDGNEYRITPDRVPRIDVSKEFPGLLNLLYCGYKLNCVVPDQLDLNNTHIYLACEDMAADGRFIYRLH